MKSSGNYGEKFSKKLPNTEAKYITGNVGVQENPASSQETKEIHNIKPPKASTQHF